MAPTIPTSEPSDFVAGDTVTWRRSVADYPATGGWRLKYAFRGVGAIDVTAATDADGVSYLVTIPAATSVVAAGLYRWAARVESADVPAIVHTISSGRVTIRPQLVAITDNGAQSHAERALALCEAQIEALLASPIETYTIEQQTTTRRKLADLESARARYQAELSQLRHRGRRRSIVAVFR